METRKPFYADHFRYALMNIVSPDVILRYGFYDTEWFTFREIVMTTSSMFNRQHR